MTAAGFRRVVTEQVKRHRFDAVFLAGLIAIAVYWGSAFVVAARGSCKEEYLASIASFVWWWSFMLVAFGLQTPLMIVTALLAVGARKSRLGARFCGAVSLALGSLILEFPVATPQGKADNLECSLIDNVLPLSEGVAYTWLLIGSILIVAGQVSGKHWTFPWKWGARIAGLCLWMRLAIFIVPWTDAYSHPLPSRLLEWRDEMDRWLHRNIWQVDIPAVGLGLSAVALMLTLLGIRRGWIRLEAIQAAILCLALVHLLVIAINVVRVIVSPLTFDDWIYGEPEPVRLAVAIIWAGFWFLLGYAFLKIRREWWERDEDGAS